MDCWWLLDAWKKRGFDHIYVEWKRSEEKMRTLWWLVAVTMRETPMYNRCLFCFSICRPLQRPHSLLFHRFSASSDTLRHTHISRRFLWLSLIYEPAIAIDPPAAAVVSCVRASLAPQRIVYMLTSADFYFSLSSSSSLSSYPLFFLFGFCFHFIFKEKQIKIDSYTRTTVMYM